MRRSGASAQRDWNRYRTIVQQLDLHVSGEFAGLNVRMQRMSRGEDALIQPTAKRRGRRTTKPWTKPAGQVAHQRELTDDQQAAMHIGKAAIHLASVVVENAQLEQPL